MSEWYEWVSEFVSTDTGSMRRYSSGGRTEGGRVASGLIGNRRQARWCVSVKSYLAARARLLAHDLGDTFVEMDRPRQTRLTHLRHAPRNGRDSACGNWYKTVTASSAGTRKKETEKGRLRFSFKGAVSRAGGVSATRAKAGAGAVSQPCSGAHH